MAQIEQTSRLRVPLSVREAWGDEAANAFTEWMETAVLPRVVPRDEYREVLSRMDVLDNRIGNLEGRMSSLERAVEQNRLEFHQRVDSMQARFDQRFDGLQADLGQRLDNLNDHMDNLNERLLVQTRWMIGALTVIGTLVTLLLAIGTFVK